MVKRKIECWEEDEEVKAASKGTKPRKSEGSPDKRQKKDQIIVYVLHRGVISSKMVQIWESRLAGDLSELGVRIAKTVSPTVNIILTDKAFNRKSILEWISSQRVLGHVSLISHEWIVELLRTRSIPDLDPFRLSTTADTPPATVLAQDSKKAAREVDLSARALDSSAAAVPSDQPHNSLQSESQTQSTQVQSLSSQVSTTIGTTEATKTTTTATASPMFARHYAAYACVKTGEVTRPNMNKHLTDILEDLQGIYDLLGDEWRAKGYKTCVGILKQLPYKVSDVSQLEGVRGVGSSIRDKIGEILSTGELKKLQYFQQDPRIASMLDFARIWGVGEKTAAQLVKQGYRTIDDLRQRGQHLLTAQQRVGLKHYEDFRVKIPRSEIDEIFAIVQQEVHGMYPGAECIVCGSYRRGKPASGDIDIIIAPPEGLEALPTGALDQVLVRLTDRGLLTDHLALPLDERESVAPVLPTKSSSSSAGTAAGGGHALVTAAGLVRGAVRVFTGPTQSLTAHATQSIIAATTEKPPSTPPTKTAAAVEQHYSSLEATQLDIFSSPPSAASAPSASILATPPLYAQASPEPARLLLKHQQDEEARQLARTETAVCAYTIRRGRASYMGVCRLPGEGRRYRRIDIKLYPRSLFAFALLYFTGSDHFNRSMRLFAKRRGFHLSDKGLVYERVVRRHIPRVPRVVGEFIPCLKEEDIFVALGLVYKKPEDRNVFDIDHLFPATETVAEDEQQARHVDESDEEEEEEHQLNLSQSLLSPSDFQLSTEPSQRMPHRWSRLLSAETLED